MTISELVRWRDANFLPDTWYLEIYEQGAGRIMTLAGIEVFARSAWRRNPQAPLYVVHTSMAGNGSDWIMLEAEPENLCPGCGAECEAEVGSFPGRGISVGEWFGVAVLVFIAFLTGIQSGAIYGWLLCLFFFLLLIGRFFREKHAIWRCPICHMYRLRKK